MFSLKILDVSNIKFTLFTYNWI